MLNPDWLTTSNVQIKNLVIESTFRDDGHVKIMLVAETLGLPHPLFRVSDAGVNFRFTKTVPASESQQVVHDIVHAVGASHVADLIEKRLHLVFLDFAKIARGVEGILSPQLCQLRGPGGSISYEDDNGLRFPDDIERFFDQKVLQALPALYNNNPFQKFLPPVQLFIDAVDTISVELGFAAFSERHKKFVAAHIQFERAKKAEHRAAKLRSSLRERIGNMEEAILRRGMK